MVREIRYRVWDGVKIKNYNEFAVEVNADKFLFGDLVKSLQDKGVIFMETTGLKDKNGVEIFEGDILTCSFIRPSRIGYVNYEVVWIKECAGFGLASLSDDGKEKYLNQFSVLNIKNHEIIGNIYEDPDLLKP